MKKFNKDYEKVIVERVLKDFEERKQERKSLELEWRLNMNFFAGNQYCDITPNGDVREYGKQYFWQEREVFNHIASIVETRIAKLLRTKIGLSVRPFSNSDSDINSAKLSTKIIKAVEEKANLTSLLNSAIMWSEVAGSCFFKVVWNGEKGRVVGEVDGKPVKEGDVQIVVVPPYEIYPDSVTRQSIEECSSIIHAKAYTIDEVKDTWGVEPTCQDVEVMSITGCDNLGGVGYSSSVNTFLSTTAKNSCLVIEKYTKPNKENPNGQLTIVAGDKLVYCGDLPYVNGCDGTRKFPFCKIHCIEKVGNFFGSSVVERMIPLQRAYNAVKNRKHEYMNRMAMGVLAVEDGSVDTDNLEEEGLSPGKILVYRQGSQPPEMMDAGRVPSDFHIEEERLLSEFVTISGVSELSKYSQTYNSMSGKAIGLLVEQDDTRLSIASGSIRECVKKIGEFVIRLYKQYAVVKRLLRLSDEQTIQTLYFSGADLGSEDIVFDCDNELSDTLAGRKNMVMELLRMGLLNESDGTMSKRNKLKVLETLGFGNWENSLDIQECHRNVADKENLKVDKEKLEVGEFDDHQLHIDQHIKYLLSCDKLDENAKNKLGEHIKEHKAMMVLGAQNE